MDTERLPRGVWLTAGGVVALLLALSGRYGFHRDELYFLAAGRRLAWGYVDQPPLVPAVARLSELALGTSPTAIRVLPALALGGVALLSALMARRFGGGRVAQIAAAAAGSTFGYALAVGHLLSTATFDLLFGALALWILTAILDGVDQRWWLALGAVVGIGLLNKYLIAVIAGTVLLGMLIERRWERFRSPFPWLGGALAIVVVLPNLVWQAEHDWPQIEMARVLAASSDGPLAFVVQQIGLLSIAMSVPMALGLWRLWRSPRLRAFRPIGIGFAVAFVVFLASGGKAYYVAPFYPVLLASGAVWFGELEGRSRAAMRWVGVLGLAVGAFLSLPLLPRDLVRYVDVTGELGETMGWEEVVAEVGAVYETLPEEQRADAVIFTGSYGQAGALEVLGSEFGLPQPVSGHNSYWLWGPPSAGGPVIAVGPLANALAPICGGDLDQVATLGNPWGVENEEAGNPVFVCMEPQGRLADIWDSLRHYN